MPAAPPLAGVSFPAAAEALYAASGVLLVGLLDASGKLLLNPVGSCVAAGQQLAVLAGCRQQAAAAAAGGALAALASALDQQGERAASLRAQMSALAASRRLHAAPRTDGARSSQQQAEGGGPGPGLAQQQRPAAPAPAPAPLPLPRREDCLAVWDLDSGSWSGGEEDACIKAAVAAALPSGSSGSSLGGWQP
jgi:hypothetical protein